MPHNESCETEILGESPFCAIAVCRRCGIYHLHMGPFSVRLKEEAFQRLCEMMAGIHYQSETRRMVPLTQLRNH